MNRPARKTPLSGEHAATDRKGVCPRCQHDDNLPGVRTGAHRLPDTASFENMALITLDAIGDAVLVVDTQGIVIYVNKVTEMMTGWGSDEALGKAVGEIFHIVDGDTRQRAVNPAHRAVREGRTVELALGSVLIRRDGTDLAIEDSAAPIFNHLGQLEGAVIVFHDARQSGAEIQKMSHRAQHDSLTGLPNRLLLLERVTHAIGMAKRHGKQIALLFLDLDHFKDINDTYGHTVGDHFLQDVAASVVSCVRATDTVSRYGGDEFVVLLTEIEQRQDADKMAQKLLAKFAQPRLVDGHKLQVTLSIGVSVYPEDGAEAETLMRNADTAMYTVKGKGRNGYQFSPAAKEPSSTISPRC